MKKIIWKCRVANEDVVLIAKEKRITLHTIKRQED